MADLLLFNASNGLAVFNSSNGEAVATSNTSGCSCCAPPFNASGCTCTTITNANGSTWTLHPGFTGMITWIDYETPGVIPHYTIGPFTFDTSTVAPTLVGSNPCTWRSRIFLGNCYQDNTSFEFGFVTSTGPSDHTVPAGTTWQASVYFEVTWSTAVNSGGGSTGQQQLELEIFGIGSFPNYVYNGVATTGNNPVLFTNGSTGTCSTQAVSSTILGVTFHPNITNP